MSNPINRRRFLLQSSAIPLALPLLPQLGHAAEPGRGVKNLIVFWVPDGTPRDRDAMVAPLLAKHRKNVAIVRRAQHTAYEREYGTAEHPNAPRCLLTGGQNAPARKWGAVDVPAGRSVDQILGSAIGAAALFPTYELGAYTKNSKDGVRHISFEAKGRPRQPVYNPLRAFTDLLSGVTGGSAGTGGKEASALLERKLRLRASVLDSAIAEVKQVCGVAGPSARDSLEAYLTSVRALEKRTEQLLAAGGSSVPAAGVQVPAVQPAQGEASFYEDAKNFPMVMELQMRIAAAALAAGRTRVLTMHWSTAGPASVPDWLPNRQLRGTTHHQLSHPGTNGIPQDKADQDRQALYTWYEQQLAFLLDRLAEVQMGDHTLLDETLVLRLSEANASGHNTNDLPIVLAGASGTFVVGKDHDMGGRPHNDLLVAILQGFGLEAQALGRDDSNRGAYSPVLR